MNVRDVMLVAFGGALGAVARYAVSLFCAGMFGERFPWGTFAVNIIGCFLLGYLLHAATTSAAISDATKLALGTGFLGAFTTFSTFGVQTVQLWHRTPISAIGNVAANVMVGLAAVAAGVFLATHWTSSAP